MRNPEGEQRIVVTGMGAVTSLGHNLDTTWENVKAGKTGFSYVDLSPSDISVVGEVKDFNMEQLLPSVVEIGGKQYPIRKVIKRLSPAAQFAISASYEALKNAGVVQNEFELDPAVNPEKFGITGASGIGGAEEVAEIYKRLIEGKTAHPSSLFTLLIERGATFLSIMVDAKGPVESVSLACASGGRAINNAVRLLLLGDAEIMVANAGEHAANQIAASLFTNTGTTSNDVSTTGAGLPFDKNRNGFVLGEGGGAMVIETLEHALRRGAIPVAEIVGYADTADAWHESDPSGKGAVRAIQKAKDKSGIDYRGRNKFIKAHATGTINGDPVEARSIKEANEEEGQILIWAPKSQLGHTLGNAGMVEAVLSIKALEEGVLPPTVNLNDPIEEIDGFEFTTENAIPMENVDIAISNSFGFGGGNAVTIFQSYDGPQPKREI